MTPEVKKESGLAIFNSPEFGSVRGFLRGGEPWFVASDVAKALGYNNPAEAVRDNCKYAELLKTSQTLVLDVPSRGLLIIPESDVYALIFRSNLPKAEDFRRWVCEEVLPSIRKTGSYALPAAQPLSATYSLEDQLKAAKFIFASHNISGEMLTLALDSYFSAETGKSALKQGNVSIIPAKQELALNVTQIGLLLKPEMKADKVNKLLEELGLQTHEGQKPKWYWKPTAKGLELGAIVEYTGKKHKTTGTPVNQVKWLSSIADFLQRYIDTESGEEE